jgi:hypothetical protein
MQKRVVQTSSGSKSSIERTVEAGIKGGCRYLICGTGAADQPHLAGARRVTQELASAKTRRIKRRGERREKKRKE